MPAIAPFCALRPTGDLAARTWRLGETPLARPGHLGRDGRAALYRYELSFGPPEARRVAAGLLCVLGAGAGTGLPEPSTSPSQVPVLLSYDDPRGWVDEVLSSNAFDEVCRFTDADGNGHRLWRVDRPEGVGEVVAQFEDRPLRAPTGEPFGPFDPTGAGPHRGILALLCMAQDVGAPWRAGLAFTAADEPAPRPWQELAGGPGKPQWRTPPLG